MQRREDAVAILDAPRELVEAKVSMTPSESPDVTAEERDDEKERPSPDASDLLDHGREGAVSRAASGRATPDGNRAR
jgi:hypothetical protein